MGAFDLKGRVAVVTGGNGGIGLGMARGLAEAGAALVVAARNLEKSARAVAELKALGADAESVTVDVTEEASVEAMVKETVARFGRLDILVNNAGMNIRKPPHELSLDEWRQVLDTNLTSAFMASHAVHPVMKRQGGGKIINIASVAGLGGAMPEVLDSIAYNTSKGGLVNFTRDLAVKWGRHKINVNAIAPGWFPSKMSSAIVERWGDRLARTIPLGRIGGDEDLKGTVVYLASRASDYITGQILAVDGGHTAL